MKHQWLKRTLSGLLAALVMTAVTPAYAQGTGSGGEKTGGAGISPLAEFFDESQMNPAYLEWLDNGGQGVMPAAQDFSYLAESYARLASM